jgi:hypothetical protein
METNMAKIEIRYHLSSKGQKILIAQGKPASETQVVVLDDLQNRLLDLAYVDQQGHVSLNLEDYTRNWHAKKDSLNGTQFWLESDGEWVKRHTYRLDSYRIEPVDAPILSDIYGQEVSMVLAVIAKSHADQQAITDSLPGLDAEDAKHYAGAKLKYEEQERLKAIRVEVRRELEATYQESSTKIENITSLIEGKNRVRTAQIRAILG